MKQIQSEKGGIMINAAKQREDESNKLCNAILQVETGLTVADEIVDEGNKQLNPIREEGGGGGKFTPTLKL